MRVWVIGAVVPSHRLQLSEVFLRQLRYIITSTCPDSALRVCSWLGMSETIYLGDLQETS